MFNNLPDELTNTIYNFYNPYKSMYNKVVKEVDELFKLRDFLYDDLSFGSVVEDFYLSSDSDSDSDSDGQLRVCKVRNISQ